MSIDDEIKKRDKDDPLHPDNLSSDVAHALYEDSLVNKPKEHEAKIDLVYEENKRLYEKEEYKD